MNHRKFSWWNTRFAYAGIRDPDAEGYEVTPDFDDGPFVFSGDTSGVSGAIKSIPDLPVTVIAEHRVSLPLAEADRPLEEASPRPEPIDRERWNDYGIGMLLQGDLASARAAFETVTAIDPTYADGFVNLARALVREGDHEAALPALERALEIDPGLGSGHYFMALALKARGRYDEALDHLEAAARRYPRDRAVRNQIGRILFLKRRHREAVAAFEAALRIDPEDLTAHYNLMLVHRALGERDAERRHEILYTRFKADEAAQAITGRYRRRHPEDNLERQPIHEHPNRYAPPAPVAAAGGTGRDGGPGG
ncbi:MAG: tetratricopeptide repeat protein [Acidobacteriota bacterium]